jgi:hypothetical protein
MMHLFMEDGRFEPEAIVAMRKAYAASLNELHDTGQLESKSSPSELLRRLRLVSAIRFACGRPRSLGLPANETRPANTVATC